MKPEEIKNLIDKKFDSCGDVYQTIEYAKSFYSERTFSRPLKPILRTPHTSEQALEYSHMLKQYEADLKIYNKNKAEAITQADIINNEIVGFIKEESGLYKIPKEYQNKVYAYAWENGHSDGYYNVFNVLNELLEIFS